MYPQDGIETVDAAYEVFLRIRFEDFQQYAFELQTCAAKNLNPQKVKEYLGIIYQQQGLAVTQVTYEQFQAPNLMILPGNYGVYPSSYEQVSPDACCVQHLQGGP